MQFPCEHWVHAFPYDRSSSIFFMKGQTFPHLNLELEMRSEIPPTASLFLNFGGIEHLHISEPDKTTKPG